jgi:hypothetical protein
MRTIEVEMGGLSSPYGRSTGGKRGANTNWLKGVVNTELLKRLIANSSFNMKT